MTHNFFKKAIISIMAIAMVFTLTMPVAFASAKDYGVYVSKEKMYNKSNKFYMKFKFTAEDYDTIFKAALVDSDGDVVYEWDEFTVNEGRWQTKTYWISPSRFNPGKYKIYIIGLVSDELYWTWNYSVTIY